MLRAAETFWGILTRQDEENKPVENQDRPEYGDVEDLEPSAEERNGNGASGPVPELELRQSTNERFELLIMSSGQTE